MVYLTLDKYCEWYGTDLMVNDVPKGTLANISKQAGWKAQ